MYNMSNSLITAMVNPAFTQTPMRASFITKNLCGCYYDFLLDTCHIDNFKFESHLLMYKSTFNIALREGDHFSDWIKNPCT